MILHLTAGITVEAADGEGSRTISGVAVPWNTDAIVSTGQRVRFLPGSLPVDGPAPKLLAHHDETQAIGLVTDRTETPDGMRFSAKISRTAAGEDALTLAADGVLDSVSVGVQPLDYKFDGPTMVVARGDWRELSLVTAPAFKAARIEQVAASEPDDEDTDIQTEEDDVQHDEHDGANTEPTAVGAAVETNLATIMAAKPRRNPSAAEWIAARMKGGSEWAEIRAADQNTDDSTGILPEPIVGPVYDGIAALRPICNAVGLRGMPGMGRTFNRPSITTHTSVGVQDPELEELSSQAMVVTPNTVTKQTVGGYVRLSEQDVDFTDPSALTLVVNDLARQYAIKTENIAASALVDAAGSSVEVGDWTDGAEVAAKVWEARTSIAASGYLPTHLFASSDRVATLGALFASGSTPLFPNLNPSNAFGSLSVASAMGMPFGLVLVESNQLDEGTMIVANPMGLELFEQQKGSIQVSDPSVLGLTVAFRGYFATLEIDDTKIVKLVDAG